MEFKNKGIVLQRKRGTDFSGEVIAPIRYPFFNGKLVSLFVTRLSCIEH